MSRIDDPLAAAEDRISAELRSESPLVPYLPYLAKVFSVLPLDSLGLTHTEQLGAKSVMGVITQWVTKKGNEHKQYLVDTLLAEVRRIRDKQEVLDEAHQRFVKEDFLPLIVDGLQKAEQTRGESRIARIAAILAHSLEVGSKEAADTAEEMMRIATILSDEDVVVLRTIVEGQRPFFNTNSGRIDIEFCSAFWATLNGPAKTTIQPLQALPIGDRQSICAKLQSLGLLSQEERIQSKLNPGEIPYGLLRKGITFVEYVQLSSAN